MDQITDIGARLVHEIGASIAASGAAVLSAAIDRTGFGSCKLVAQMGTATGTPTAQTLAVKLTECATAAGTYTDFTDPATGVAGAITTIAADGGKAFIDINLTSALKFLKVSSTLTLTAGTSPTCPSASALIMGGADVKPAA